MNALWELPVYWLNFLLHTALLSVFAWGLSLVLRDPGRRAFAAAAGVFAIIVIPWITANGLLPVKGVPEEITRSPSLVQERDLSEWVVRIDRPVAVAAPVPVEITPEPESEAHPFIGWRLALAGLWISGTVAGLLLVIVRHAALGRRLRSLRPPVDAEWANLYPHAGLPRPAFLISGTEIGPCAIGFLRQRIALPVDMVAEGGGGLRWALRHEEEHLQASDPRMAVFLSLAKCVLWWNPLVHVLGRVWMEGRERFCDARALDGPEEGRYYGAFLVNMAEGRTAVAGMPMAGGGARRLRKRIRALLGGGTVAPRSALSRTVTLALLASGGLLACCFGVEEKKEPRSSSAPHKMMLKDATTEPGGGRRVEDGQKVPVQAPRTKVVASFIRSNFAFPEAGSVLSDPEKQLMLRRAAQKAGTDLLRSPILFSTDGQTASMCMINTQPANDKIEVEKVRTIPFVGLSLRTTPRVKGGKVSLSVDCLINYEPGRLPIEWKSSSEFPEGGPRTPDKDFDWSTVRSASAQDTKELSAGDSMVVAFKGSPEGIHLTGIFTVVPVDPTGRELESFSVPTSNADPDNPAPEVQQVQMDADGTGLDGKSIKLSSKLILSEQAIPEMGKILSDAEAVALMRRFSEDGSTKLHTAPSVTTRSGQRSKVEIIRVSPDGRAPEGKVESREFPFAGLLIESTAELAGDRIGLSFDARYNHPSGRIGLLFDGGFPEEIPADFNWAQIRSSHAKGEATLKPGECILVPFGNVEQGKHLMVMFHVVMIPGPEVK